MIFSIWYLEHKQQNNKQVWWHQTKDLLQEQKKQSKSEKATYRMGKHFCECVWQGVTIQNTERTHTTQYQKITKLKVISQLTSKSKAWVDIFPKQIKDWPKRTWEDASITRHYGNAKQHHNGMPSHACQSGHQKKTTGNKHWWECGPKRTPVHICWGCKLVRPLWKTVCRILEKLK